MKTQRKQFIVVATEPTPNPAALKFNLNQKVSSQTLAFGNEDDAEGDPFAEKIFAFGVVQALLIHDRFVSVTLDPGEDWELFLDPVIDCIEQHLVAYEDETPQEKKKTILDEVDIKEYDKFDDDIKEEIIDAFMDESVRPALASDGGGVIVNRVDGDIVYIGYQGACGSCSKSNSSTLSAMQNILQSNVSPNIRVIIGGGNC